LTKTWKIRTGGGVYDYGNPRAWGDNAVWKFQRQRGVEIWKPSVVWYGYFLELPIDGRDKQVKAYRS